MLTSERSTQEQGFTAVREWDLSGFLGTHGFLCGKMIESCEMIG